MKSERRKVIVAVSGGFDPLHIGHVRLFEAAKKLGNKLVVILNNDNWLLKKKGFVFMAQKERAELLKSIKWVDSVVLSAHKPNPKDMSVCAELRKIRPQIFANGGDRNKRDADMKTSSLNADQRLCQKLGISMVFNVGKGGKLQSSSWLVVNYLKAVPSAKRKYRE